METKIQHFLEAGLAEPTIKVYRSGWQRYLSFNQAFSLPTSPVNQDSVTLFVAFLGLEGLSVSTIESYLAALRHFRLLADPTCLAPSFFTPHMKVLLRGIKRVHSQQQAAPRIRLPITSSLMRCLTAHLSKDPSRYTNCLIWAAACTGFFGFLRCSEFVVPDRIPFHPSQHLCLKDISFRQESPQWFFLINVKVLITDQFRQGAQVVLGVTGTDLCPVAALLDYLSTRGPRSGPLFVLEDGQPLRRS